MSQTDDILKDLLKEIDNAIESFHSSIPGIQREIYTRIQNLLRKLDVRDDKIVNSVANLKTIARLKKDIEKAILNPDYIKQTADFTDAFKAITNLQSQYFAAMNVEFSTPKMAKVLQTQAIEETITSLTESGISSQVSEGVRKILKSNTVGESNYTDLIDQMRTHILTDKSGLGALERYTKQITTDALNQFSAQYNQLLISDLGFTWFQYVGSLLETSRPFCKAMVAKRWIYIDELPEIMTGKIGTQTVWINPKTDVWAGGIVGTTPENFPTNRGGHNCGHQFLGVADRLVPKDVRREVYQRLGLTKKLEALEQE